MDLDDDTHREDQFSSSYETPTVPATHKEPTGMRPKFFEESILKQMLKYYPGRPKCIQDLNEA